MSTSKTTQYFITNILQMTAPSALFSSARTISPLLSPIPNRRKKKDFNLLSPRDEFVRGVDDEKYFQIGEEKDEEEEVEEEEEVTEEESNNNYKRIRINKKLLIYKAFYFLFYGAVGSLFPYLAVFYKQLYLSAQQVGFLIGVRPFIQMCAGPLWGALADTYNVKKLILLMSIAAWLGTNYSISIVRIPPETACNSNFSIIRIPEIGKITENRKLPSSVSEATTAKNSSLLSNSTELIMHSRTVPKNNSSSEILTKTLKKLRQKRKIEKENISTDSIHSSTNDITMRIIKRKLKRSAMPVFYSKSVRGADYITNTRNQQWSYLNTSEQLLPLQRILAADELEEEFDSLNTDDDYPWPIGNIENAEKDEVNEVSKDSLKIFIVLIIITVIGTLFASPAATLADTATLENLGTKPYNYGYQRLWGAFGWGLCAFFVGAIVSVVQNIDCANGKHVDYILSFYVYAAMMVLAFLCAMFFEFEPVDYPESYTDSLWEAITLFSDCQHTCFVITLLCSGAAMGFIHTFLFWHLHDIGGSQFLFSVIAAVQCISEVCMYLISSYLILHLGCESVLYIGLLANVLRLFAYSVITQPIYSVPLEVLQGVSSASIWSAAICYIGLIPGTPVTLQALLHGMYWGLGHGGGGILGGVLVTYIGSNATFITYGIVCLVNLLILVTFKYWSKLMELLGNYTYVENIPAGTYILTTNGQRHREAIVEDEEPHGTE